MRHRSFVLVLMLISCALAGNPLSSRAAESLPLDQRAQWFRQDRFGMFIHWGVYSVIGRGEWIQDTGKIPLKEYEQNYPKFNPVQFDADRWVGQAKQAGQRYIVITTKHHDGFCMFDSKLSDYTIMHTPVKRDVCKELSEACRQQGLKLGFYYSIMDWHHPDYTPRRPWEKDRTTDGADFDRYVEYMRGQIRELMTNYGEIAVLWFDGGWERTAPEDLQKFRDIIAMARQLQPKMLVNNRANIAGDFETPEQFIPATGVVDKEGRPALWEVCLTMTTGHGSFAPTAWWGYDRHETVFKPADQLIQTLIDVVSKGGNLLLNVGPAPEGVIRPEESERLAAVGRWMERHAEAIYETQASPFRLLPFFGRATRKGKLLYVHVFDWPQDRQLVLPGLKDAPLEAYMLEDPDLRVGFSRQPQGADPDDRPAVASTADGPGRQRGRVAVCRRAAGGTVGAAAHRGRTAGLAGHDGGDSRPTRPAGQARVARRPDDDRQLVQSAGRGCLELYAADRAELSRRGGGTAGGQGGGGPADRGQLGRPETDGQDQRRRGGLGRPTADPGRVAEHLCQTAGRPTDRAAGVRLVRAAADAGGIEGAWKAACLMWKRIILMLLVMAALIALVWYSQQRPELANISGFIEADEIRLGSRVGGRVARVHVEEGQAVRQGDALLELEPFDLLELEQEAEAEVAAKQAEYDRLQAGFRAEEKGQAKARVGQLQAKLDQLVTGPRPQEKEAGRGQLKVAESTLKLAQQNHVRVSGLFQKGAVPREQFDEATEKLQAAQAMVIVRQQELSLLEAGTRTEDIERARAELEEAQQALALTNAGYRPEEVAAAKAARDAAGAALAAIRTRKKELRVVAPVDGTIEAQELQPGDLTLPGAPVLSMVDNRRLWVRAYLPENRLDVKLGQKLWVTVDSHPGRRFAGEVTFLARQAEFTPSNIQTPEERSKQVFRIKVTLKEGLDVLRPGMSADVWLEN